MGRAVQTIPDNLLEAYTLNGSVNLEHMFVDDSVDGGTHYQYPGPDILAFVKSSQAILASPSTLARSSRVGRARSWIVQALQLLPTLSGIQACVFGSQEPWAEALLVAAGVAQVHAFGTGLPCVARIER